MRFKFMACYSPLQAFQSIRLNSRGKTEIVFKVPSDKFRFKEIKLPCSQCVGCRLERSRQWAIRCMHEASLYDDNCFITLTFSDEALNLRDNPKSLDVRDFQLFMKRLRKEFGEGIRFYHCGEYGEQYGRPHYHACLFNIDFKDKYLWQMRNGFPLYRSPTLERLWPFGHSSIGSVTFESAAYVARYIMKKKFGKGSSLHYCDIDFETGEILGQRAKEYTTMSRKPGIAKGWLDKYLQDVYQRGNDCGSVRINGMECLPPRFYDSQYEIQYPSDFLSVKQARVDRAKRFASDNTPERLRVKEIIAEARLKHLPRNYG